MGHSKIYKNESEFIIANVMDDVENVDAREYFINFHAKSIYPAIEELILKDKTLDKTYRDPITIMLAAKKLAKDVIANAESQGCPDNIKKLFEEDLSKKEQISLLKGTSIKTEQLTAIYMQMTKDINIVVTDMKIHQKNMLELTYHHLFI